MDNKNKFLKFVVKANFGKYRNTCDVDDEYFHAVKHENDGDNNSPSDSFLKSAFVEVYECAPDSTCSEKEVKFSSEKKVVELDLSYEEYCFLNDKAKYFAFDNEKTYLVTYGKEFLGLVLDSGKFTWNQAHDTVVGATYRERWAMDNKLFDLLEDLFKTYRYNK